MWGAIFGRRGVGPGIWCRKSSLKSLKREEFFTLIGRDKFSPINWGKRRKGGRPNKLWIIKKGRKKILSPGEGDTNKGEGASKRGKIIFLPGEEGKK